MRTLYSFDRDATVDVGGGPVGLAIVRHLVQVGNEVWAHGNQLLCEEAGIPGVVQALERAPRTVVAAMAGADLGQRRERLRLIASLFPGLPKVCIDDEDLSDLEGWRYFAPHAFVTIQPWLYSR